MSGQGKPMKNYSDIFNQDKVIRHLFGYDLGRVIPISTIGYFIIILLFMALITNIFPFSIFFELPIISLFNNVLIKYIVIPGVLSYGLANTKLDGKKPIHFIRDYFRYMRANKYHCMYKDIENHYLLINHQIMYKNRRDENGSV